MCEFLYYDSMLFHDVFYHCKYAFYVISWTYQCTICCNCVALNIGVYPLCTIVPYLWILVSCLNQFIKALCRPFRSQISSLNFSSYLCIHQASRIDTLFHFSSMLVWRVANDFSKDTIFPWNITSQLRHGCSMSWVCKACKTETFPWNESTSEYSAQIWCILLAQHRAAQPRPLAPWGSWHRDLGKSKIGNLVGYNQYISSSWKPVAFSEIEMPFLPWSKGTWILPQWENTRKQNCANKCSYDAKMREGPWTAAFTIQSKHPLHRCHMLFSTQLNVYDLNQSVPGFLGWLIMHPICTVYIYIYRHICISFITYIYISYMCLSCSASPYNTSISSYHLWLWGLWAARDIASRRASFWWMTWWPPQGWRVKVLHFGNLAGNPGWRWNLFLIHPGVKWREIIEELKTNRLTCHIDKQSTFIERHAVKCIFFA